MRFSSAVLTVVDPDRRFLAFLLFFRMRWEVRAWNRLTFPEPVSLKRFFALECVFIFGIIDSVLSKQGAKIRKAKERKKKT